MVTVKRIVLDVLKPHQPNALDFCREIARLGPDYQVCLSVEEMDENTQTLQLEVRGNAVELEPIETLIVDMGASLHSIDLVEVHNEQADS
jgi:hypothetical protein